MKSYSSLQNAIFLLFIIFSLIIFALTIFDILLNLGFMIFLLAGYVIILVLMIISVFIVYSKNKIPVLTVDEFEKSLSGGLFHFKCPVCGGIFAVKKSKGNEGVNTKMTCPDCGILGIITKNPDCVIDEIPEKKSIKANFRCKNCGGRVTVWAEGSDLYSDTKVLICPFCKNEKPLQKL